MTPTDTQQIVKAYREQLDLTLKEFAEQLSEPLSVMNMAISYGSIQHWEAGRYEPDDDKLHLLTICARPHTWQWHFASDVRAAKYPTVYQPMGEIGQRILMAEAEDAEQAHV